MSSLLEQGRVTSSRSPEKGRLGHGEPVCQFGRYRSARPASEAVRFGEDSCCWFWFGRRRPGRSSPTGSSEGGRMGDYFRGSSAPVASLKMDQVIFRSTWKSRMVVADIGADRDSFPGLAKAAPAGKIYAVDIQQDSRITSTSAIRKRISAMSRRFWASNDPANCRVRNVDLAFINASPYPKSCATYLVKALGSYLKPSGRVAIIEMDKNDPNTAQERSGTEAAQPGTDLSMEVGRRLHFFGAGTCGPVSRHEMVSGGV